MLNTKENNHIIDVLVIGGGPSGMMAAAIASARGLSVFLAEKNSGLGKKLLITGGGRCNVTNNKPVVREILREYKEAGKFLFSTYMQFGVTETIAFFKERGLLFKEENEGRLFPITEKAQSVYDVLVKELQQTKVEVKTNCKVIDVKKQGEYFVISLEDKSTVFAKNVVLATGGQSRPETGSTGDGLPWLKNFGHKINEVSSALVPVVIKDSWVKKLAGVTLPHVKISLYFDNTKKQSQTGRLLCTHFGVSGPLILNMSKTIGSGLEEGMVTLKLDVLPNIEADLLQVEILKLFQENLNKKLKNVLPFLIETALVTPVLDELAISGETFVNNVTAPERKKIAVLLKSLTITVERLMGSDKAIVSSGGVDLKEVNFKTMSSRLIPGLYLVGDVLDINRPSGGYSLQLSWSTGAVAGLNI